MNAVGQWYQTPGRKAHLVTLVTDYHLYTLCGRRLPREAARLASAQASRCQRCQSVTARAQARWTLDYLQEIARFEKETTR